MEKVPRKWIWILLILIIGIFLSIYYIWNVGCLGCGTPESALIKADLNKTLTSAEACEIVNHTYGLGLTCIDETSRENVFINEPKSIDKCNNLLENELKKENITRFRFTYPNLLNMIKKEYSDQLDDNYNLVYSFYEYISWSQNDSMYEICIYKSKNVMFIFDSGYSHCFTLYVYIIPKLTDTIDNLIRPEYLDYNNFYKNGTYSDYVNYINGTNEPDIRDRIYKWGNRAYIEDDKIILTRGWNCG